MYLQFTVPLPDKKSGITQKTIKGTTYVYYEFERKYDPDKKYTIPQTTTIGKISTGDPKLMVPNGNYVKFFPEAELPEEFPESTRSGCLKIGSFLAIKKVIDHYGLKEALYDIIGEDCGLFLDLAAYAIVAENNASQYYPDYAYCHPLFTPGMKVYSDSKVSMFLRKITRDQAIQFQNRWNAGRDHNRKIYLSYDSTNKHCQSGDIELAEFGNDKEKQKKPIYNFSIGYDSKNGVPLFYEQYPGSINDIFRLQYMLEKAAAYGYKDVGFILDRGCFSKENIRFMDCNGYDFIIMVKGCKELASGLILEQRGKFEDEWDKAIPYYDVNGITIKSRLYATDDKERYFHIFFSDYKKAAECSKLQQQIKEDREFLESMIGSGVKIDKGYTEYFDLIYWHPGKPDQKLQFIREREDVISRDIKLCGYFAIITSSEMTAEQALDLYKSRDVSEKLFRGDKSYLGEQAMRVYGDEPLHAKIFIEFVALIIRNKLYTCLKDRMKEQKKNYMTVPAAIKELNKIELIRQANGTYMLDHAVSATQKDMLQAFNMTATSVKKEAGILSRELIKITN